MTDQTLTIGEQFLSSLGLYEDTDSNVWASREDTPRRMAKLLAEFVNGERAPLPNLKAFVEPGADQMVVVRNIEFYSLCEHHLVPFFGTIDMAYLPNDGLVLGLSKLPRIAQWAARRVTVQERVTNLIADTLSKATLSPSVGVVVRARHLCMEMRGIRQSGAYTVTSDLRGAFRDTQGAVRQEFLSLTQSPHV